MRFYRRLIAVLAALLAFLPLAFVAESVNAQQYDYKSAGPRINGFDVEPAPQAAPGNELFFTVHGSPAGTATIHIDGASTNLILDEVEPGVYEGVYTIKRRDQITTASTATVNLRLGNRIASSVLDESLLAGAPALRSPQAAALPPRVTSFVVEPPGRLVAGADMFIALTGDPGGVEIGRASCRERV